MNTINDKVYDRPLPAGESVAPMSDASLPPQPAELAPLMAADGAFAPEWFNRFEDLQPYAATLSKFRRPEALAKSYAHLERLKGYPDPQDAERMAAFRLAVGLPEAAADYCLPRPENTPDELWDESLVKALSGVAHEYGVPPRAMEALSARYAQEGNRALAACQEAQLQAIEQADAELQRDWGRHYEQNMDKVGAYLGELGSRAGVDVQALMENPALRANADFARLMLAAATEVQESPLREGAPSDARHEAHRIVHDSTHPLHEAYMRTNHPQHRYANAQYDRLAFGKF